MSEDRGSPAADASDVLVDVEFRHGLLFLVIANIGQRPAFDVSVTFEPPFRGLGGAQVMAELAVFHRLAFLAPGRRIEVFCDSAAAYFSRREPERIEARVAYRDDVERSRKTSIRHDLSIYRALPFVDVE